MKVKQYKLKTKLRKQGKIFAFIICQNGLGTYIEIRNRTNAWLKNIMFE